MHLLVVHAATWSSSFQGLHRYRCCNRCAVRAVLQDDDLAAWIASRGGCSSVSIATRDGLRGLVANQDAAVGDVLLSVPMISVMCDASRGSDQLPGAAPTWAASLPSKVQLAMLTHMHAPSSEWAPFLRSWPSAAPSSPSDADLLALSCAVGRSDSSADPHTSLCRTWARSTTSAWIDEQYALATELYAQSHGDDTQAGGAFPTRDAFHSSMRLVGSRCLRLSAGPFGTRALLVPLLDMANHDGVAPSALYAFSPEEVADSSTADGAPPLVGRPASIQLIAARPLRADEAVTISYGEHTNAEFVRSYGFVPLANPHDCEVISLRGLLEAAVSMTPTKMS